MDHLVPAVVVAILCAAGGLAVPALIARIPEPEPLGPEPGEPDEAGASAAPPEEKEPYAAIAALPGLAWRSALASGVAGASVGAELGWAWPLVYLVPLVPVAVALAVVDWRTRLLPTKVIAPSYALVVVGVLVCWVATRETDDLARAGLGWLLSGGLFWLLWRIHPRGMGYGDVRLSGVLGIALGQLGWGPLLVGVYSGFLIGALVGGLLSVLRVVDRKAYPFGPFMLVGALVGIIWGDPLLSGLVSG
jgi:leader peptidase (prepilin peptidase) / N-methyltransferase